jgi:Glutamate decarboxylase and related PLP-dependent proteins
MSTLNFPKKSKSTKELLDFVNAHKSKDVDWKKGRAFCLVYSPGEERTKMIKEIFDMYYSDNALNPGATPSLTKMETQVISMCADLFNGDEKVRGNITSGGTESILLAIKTARDWAKKNKPNITKPEVIIPASAHPAFIKAFQYKE